MCKRSVPDFDQCLINSIETLRPHLAKGKYLLLSYFVARSQIQIIREQYKLTVHEETDIWGLLFKMFYKYQHKCLEINGQ